MNNTNTNLAKLDVRTLEHDPNLKNENDGLVEFIAETMMWEFNSEYAPFTVQHGISYLDALCSVRFDKLGRSDKKKIVKVMEMVLAHTNRLMEEAKQGLEGDVK